mmetsp:Transcript_26964/g.48515  ORF Transcript_26964/g.48515 Transcript_26964/m.48515 type:complete len:160 (-) Transcript_26964:679-1158(-)
MVPPVRVLKLFLVLLCPSALVLGPVQGRKHLTPTWVESDPKEPQQGQNSPELFFSVETRNLHPTNGVWTPSFCQSTAVFEGYEDVYPSYPSPLSLASKEVLSTEVHKPHTSGQKQPSAPPASQPKLLGHLPMGLRCGVVGAARTLHTRRSQGLQGLQGQ